MNAFSEKTSEKLEGLGEQYQYSKDNPLLLVWQK